MQTRLLFTAALCLVWIGPSQLAAADVKIVLPLQRKVYQTNERIDVDVVRSADKGLAAGDLVLAVQGEDGSKLTFTFPVKAASGGPGAARAVEHLHVNGWLLRPGKYTVEASCDGTGGKADFEVYSHVRRSSFKLINWGRAKGAGEQLPQGEESLGYNLFYGHYGQDEEGNFIRAGVDFMSNCTMSGGHQMDLRTECDWSDPLVIRGGTRRVARRAFIDRTRPNVFGVHFYDEPGLTWLKHPVTGENSPHDIPSQVRSYEAAFGRKPIPHHQLDAKNPAQVAEWRHWARWKLGFMDAAWKDAQFGVSAVRPDYLSVTQSQYGFSAFTDGYYFNVVRSLPVISGHGGYHDFGPGFWNPPFFLEFARARDITRPNWYLPTWYGNTTPDQFRLEQYLSFQTNLQGMMSPPDMEPGQPAKSKGAAGIVQANHLMGRLGTVFTTLPVERPPVTVLFSLSQLIRKQTENPKKVNYAHDTTHGQNVVFTYLAGKRMQQPFMVVLDEDVRDGTLAAHHKAIILTSLDYLDSEVMAGLQDFAKKGGLVLLTADCKVDVKGGINLGVTPGYPEAEKIAALLKAGKNKEVATLTQMRQALQGAQKLADAIRPRLQKAGIKPVLESDLPGISATRQGAGDIEYLFAVNASHDLKGDPMLGVQAVTAKLGLEADGRPVYDAVHGGAVPEFAQGKAPQGEFRFGPGQMRVFARTARPIGGVRAGTPLVRRDYTLKEAPVSVELSAALLDDKGRLLSGSAPLRIRVLDPLGAVRYDLYRATDRGTLTLSVPLALNDPAGKWTVKVTELLNNTEDAATFTYPAVPTASIAAGATRRAVHVEQDRANVFRFFRTHHKLTLVIGSSDYNKAAAERLTRFLKPWNVACKTITAAEANHPRSLSAEEAKTWAGMDAGRANAGDKNNPGMVGFAVQGPVVLLGTAEDNPLIKFLDTYRFLPYKPSKGDMPGPGRGYVAWQRDGVGAMQESITLIAYDDAGMAEAVGSLYEMAAGIEPLTPLALPRGSTVTPATKAKVLPRAEVAWSAVLPDSVVGLKAEGGKLVALTHAGVLAELGPEGKVQGQQIVEGPAYEKSAKDLGTPTTPAALAEAQKASDPRRVVKFVVPNGQLKAVAYWGGAVRVVDGSGAVRAAYRLPQDVTAVTWRGGELVVGDADGRVVALKVR